MVLNNILNLIYIQLIVIFIVDLSGIVPNLKILISKLLTKGKISTDNYTLKPLDCSLCLSFWLNIIYLIITNNITLGYILIVCILSYLTRPIANLIKYIEYKLGI